jgi:pimeloyl-ACP methyl ester carboxylesterase
MRTMPVAPRRAVSKQRGVAGWVGRGIGWLLVFLAVLALLGASYEALMVAGDTTRYPPPGRLVDAGGYRLHIACAGDGGPTVVLVAGLGGSSLLWERVQPLLPASTRVCVYDRAGLGWSDAGDQGGTPDAAANELHALLTKAAVPGPYVLVGASIGGKYVRMFAERYPTEVAGMVLVDARHETVNLALTPNEQAETRANAQRDAQLYWLLGRLGIMRLFGAGMAAGMSPGAAQLPESTRTLLMVQAARPHSIDAMLREHTGSTADDERLRAARPLDPLPLVVLAADSSVARSPEWGAAQEAQRQLSTNSRLTVVAQSSHHLALDQPQAVTDAILEVASAARTGRLLAP